MTTLFQPIELTSVGADAVRAAFTNQVEYCQKNGAPITARIVAATDRLLDQPQTIFARTVRDWQGAPLADALALRAAGGLHSLRLAGVAPSLDAIYDGLPGDADDDAARVAMAVADHQAALLPWLDGPPQTNEAGRSSNFIAAMLWLAGQGLPPRFACMEIGSSAGINLMIDRYRYNLNGVSVGPDDAVMHFDPEWRGPPPPDHAIAFERLAGCDVAPVDLTDPAQALRLMAYVWPEHHQRFARITAAIAATKVRQPDLVAMNAADFVETQLAEPQAKGTTRVLMHSIVWQYVPADQQARVTAAMERAGAAASADRPLAWVALEANRTVHHHELVVRYWPGGGAPTKLGTAHAHGAWLDWNQGLD